MHVSLAHFSRDFRKTFCKTPHQYLLTRCPERAVALVGPADLPDAEVCLAIGLRTIGSFATSFTRADGISPAAYRFADPRSTELITIPTCMQRAWGRPTSGKFREDTVLAQSRHTRRLRAVLPSVHGERRTQRHHEIA